MEPGIDQRRRDHVVIAVTLYVFISVTVAQTTGNG